MDSSTRGAVLFGARNWSVASITRRKRYYLTACGVILIGVALQFWDEKNATHSHNMTECGKLTVLTTNDMDQLVRCGPMATHGNVHELCVRMRPTSRKRKKRPERMASWEPVIVLLMCYQITIKYVGSIAHSVCSVPLLSSPIIWMRLYGYRSSIRC